MLSQFEPGGQRATQSKSSAQPRIFSLTCAIYSLRVVIRGGHLDALASPKSTFSYWATDYDSRTYREFETLDLAEGEMVYQERFGLEPSGSGESFIRE